MEHREDRFSRQSDRIGSVPQSVPPGTPRKPLQGLAVPQFHDFRKIGEKNIKKYLRAAHEKGLPHVPPHMPGLRLDRSRWDTDPRTGEESPTTPVSRLVCGQERRSSDGGRRGSKKEEKHRFFSPIPAGFRRIYFEAGIKTGVGFAPAPFTSTRNGGLFWAFVKPQGRNLRRGRFGFVSPRFVLSPFLPIQGGNA